MKDQYYESEEFRELLENYENSTAHGGNIYLDAEEFCDIADFYLQRGKAGQALEVAERGLRLHSDDDDLLTVKSSVLIYMHDYKAAEAILDSCSDQKQSDVLYQRAQLQYSLYNNVERAEEIFRDWIELEYENNRWETDENHRQEMARDCYIHIISSFIELVENHEYDEELVYRWIEDYLVTFSPLGNYDSDLILADTVREEAMLDMVIRVYCAILETNPYINKGYSVLGSAQLAAGDFSAALESADFALAIDPEDMEAVLTKAHAFMSLENYADAETLLREYMGKREDESQAIALAYCCIYLDKDEEAYGYLLRAENYLKDNDIDEMLLQQFYGELSEGFLAIEKGEEALRCVNRVLQYDEMNQNAYFVRGTVYLLLNNLEKAIDDLLVFIMMEKTDWVRSVCMVFQRLAMFNHFFIILEMIDYYENNSKKTGDISLFLPYKALALFQKEDTSVFDFLDVLKESGQLHPEETKVVLGHLFPEHMKPEEYYPHMCKMVDTLIDKFESLEKDPSLDKKFGKDCLSNGKKS